MITEIQAREAFGKARNREQMDRLYRALSKRIHPDQSGDSGEAFIILKREYDAALFALGEGPAPGDSSALGESSASGAPRAGGKARATAAKPGQAFDPFKLARDMGFAAALDARANLYLALRRYNMVDLHLHKIRTSQSLRKRNEAILATIEFWARRYSPALLAPFRAWNDPEPRGIASSEYSRLEHSATLWLKKGLEHFFLFQEDGRDSLRAIARSSLEEARELTRSYGLELSGPLGMAEWLLAELEKPPALRR